MNIRYLILILTLILFGCTEPEVLSCPGSQTEDQCGVCCDENSNSDCSNGPNTGAMDACGTCFGEIQDENDCMGLCTDPEAGNYNQAMHSIECPCNYNSSFIEVECCGGDECDDIIGPSEDGVCYMLIENPVLEIDLQFLMEDDFCQGDFGCDTYTNKECCEDMIDPLSGCTDPHTLDCEWIASFTTKSCRPIYFINTSDQDIIITTIDTPINQCIGINNCSNYNESSCNTMVGCEWEEFDDYNPLWNNFLDGESIPSGTIFNPETHTFYLQDVCSQIDTQEDVSCNVYDNKNECNNNEHCNWYESYNYVLGNTNLNGAFQSSSSEYQFCLQGSQKCGIIIIE